jgi:hypothetical protein
VNVWDLVLGSPRRTRLGDRIPLVEARTAPDEHGAQVRQRRLVPIRRLDRDGEPMGRNLARERHLATDGRPHNGGAPKSDVYPPVLAARIGVVTERELAEDVAVCRPCPGAGAWSRDERPRDRSKTESRQSRCPMR